MTYKTMRRRYAQLLLSKVNSGAWELTPDLMNRIERALEVPRSRTLGAGTADTNRPLTDEQRRIIALARKSALVAEVGETPTGSTDG